MFDPKMLNEFGAKMNEFMANSPAKDLEKNAKAMASNFFANLDLVQREEFEVQTALLANALQQIKALEARIAALESARQDS